MGEGFFEYRGHNKFESIFGYDTIRGRKEEKGADKQLIWDRFIKGDEEGRERTAKEQSN